MSEVLGYEEGIYSKITLSDGNIIMLSCEINTIRVVQMSFLGLLPKKQLGRVGGLSQEKLTNAILECKNIQEVRNIISTLLPP